MSDAPDAQFSAEQEAFLQALRRDIPEGAELVSCSFRGDPAADARGKWRARAVQGLGSVDPEANVYWCVSAMRPTAEQAARKESVRRRKENFAGGLVLMIDDVGTGTGSKFPLGVIDAAPPTAMVETSPNNFQAMYFMDGAVESIHEFGALIEAFIREQFLGKDTGMAGVNRVFRPPFGVNGKPQHGGWRVRLGEWRPERRFTVGQLVSAFNLSLAPQRRPPPRGATADKADCIRRFVSARQLLRSAGMLKAEVEDMAGWTPVVCPWTGDHTAGADNGAGIRQPDADNGYNGAFKCHHGGCADRGWRELTEWLAEEAASVLHDVNATAPATAGHFNKGESQK